MKQSSLVVVVTGCSSGFGHLMIEPLAKAGHTVFATMREINGRNREAADALRNLSGSLKVHVLELDATSDASVDAAVGSVLREAGHIDVVVNNAGIMPVGVTEAFTIDQMRTTFEANVLGSFRVIRAVLPGMRRQGSGLLVQISSVNGRISVPFMGVYNASKYAVEGLAETLGYELAPFGIESCIVEPGPFPTQLLSNSPAPADAARVADYGEMGKGREKILGAADVMFADAKLPVQNSLVVSAVVDLIGRPAGERPLRTVVGLDLGAAKLNELTAPFAKNALEALHMPELENVKTARRK